MSGIGVSAGIVIGEALHVGHDGSNVEEIVLAPEEVDDEVARFQEALKASEEQLEEVRARAAEVLGEKDARIFDAHLMLVADQVLIEEVIETIRNERRNAEFVFNQVIERYGQALKQVDDTYIRDRLADIRDVADRVIRNLKGEKAVDLTRLDAPKIVIARDLSPSDTASMDRENVIGFVTALGSRTSHTAIMARSMNIPAVVGIMDALDQIRNGDELILDGLKGVVIIRPDDETRQSYKERIKSQIEWLKKIETEATLPTETTDGFRVQLAANIELPEEVESIRSSYGVGIGLFRTEYLFINQTELPNEEQQLAAYRKVVEDIYPESTIIRTLDIGGDKFISNLRVPSDLNPFLGMRAIRFCLSRPDIFMIQLRAILRASTHGKVRILFPMISTIEEVQQALDYLQQARAELDAEGIHYNRHMDVGIMIEVPAAALLADQLAPYVDFFSLGTNDLIQYALAADRANPDIAYLYQPSHPSIIRLIKDVVHAAYAHGKWVSICGEMAGEPLLVPLVLGLGIHELSMGAVSIGLIKRLIRRMAMHEAEHLVEKALDCGTAAEVRKLCEDFVQRVAPDLFPG
ncbi:MAG: phosphoenolpyruvate--protein phosphotransferase [Candidatus Pacebacteria bacterium]|nr:phosphoenolpyruvate--protein phosphotransferase [Candidatus Paceibacterota bacterium]